MTRTVRARAALVPGLHVEPWTYEQRAPRPDDVVIEVLFSGICHTDIHMTSGGWGRTFPLVPGHETVGRVVEVGSAVRRFTAGDVVATGTIVDSCRECAPCRDGQETYCLRGATPAYDGTDRVDGSTTRGSYADLVVCDQRFTYPVPPALDLTGVAPLLCAGITCWSPLKHWGVGPGSVVGVVGIGGLGHLGLKLARALGAHVVAFTTSAAKASDAVRLGAHEVVLSTDPDQMAAQTNNLDFVLDTASATYPMTPVIQTLRVGGTLCSVGLPARFDVEPYALATGRRSIAGSGSGGTTDTTEMLEFCAEHQIVADVESVGVDDISDALARLADNDVRYRFVIDMNR